MTFVIMGLSRRVSRVTRFLANLLATMPLVAAGLSSSAAHAQHPNLQNHTILFDPLKCPDDPQGMVYFAVGRHVLRQPMENLTYIAGGDAAFMASLPKPPKPQEPQGCPGHPLQGAAFHLSHLSSMPGDPANSAGALADELSLVLNSGTVALTFDGAFHGICDKYGLRDDRIPGLIACKKPFRCDGDIAYMTKEYEAPIGGKISFFCRVGINCTSRPVLCDGGYRLHEDFVVDFEFLTTRLPVEDFVEADREIRRRIKAAEVFGYPWSQSQADNNPERTP
jgi:hypothetical protein